MLVGFLLVGLLPTVAGILYFSRQLGEYQDITAEQVTRAQAGRAADRLAGRISGIIDTLAYAQRLLHVRADDQSVLEWCYNLHPELLKLAVIDADDRMVSSLFRYGYAAKGSQVHHVEFAPGQAYRVAFEFWNLEPQLRVYFPIEDLASGRVKGSFHAQISLKHLFAELPRKNGGSDGLYVVSESGRVVSHSNINHVLNGLDLSSLEVIEVLRSGAPFNRAEYRNPEGEPVIGVGIRVPGLPLYILKEIPVEEAYALSRQLNHGFYVALLMALLLLLVTAYFLSRAITRPVERLEQATRRVEEGDLYFSLVETAQTFPDEMGDLAIRFNGMVEALEREHVSQQQAEDELRNLRNYLSNIIDSMPSVLVGVDADVRVTQWNQEAERKTGILPEQAMGKPLTEVFPQLAQEVKRVRQAIRERRALVDSKVPANRDGAQGYSDITIYPLITNCVEGAVIRVDDVTERVRIEEMMIQSEKMLSIGGLAAGMAHEINNPLAGMLQNVQVMRNRILDDIPRNRQEAEACGLDREAMRCYMERREIFTMIEAVLESGERAANIVTNMLNFSRKSDVGIEPHDIARLMEATLELAVNDYDLKRKYDFRKIKINREYDDKLPPVACDSPKIQQVFLNLLKNGAEAMVESADEGKVSEFTLRIRREKGRARIEIEDNGPGMAESVRKHIFEPFFTTKGVGLGTGLGLSVSYFIIHENHGGTMNVDSRPGRGTCFIIELPLHQGG